MAAADIRLQCCEPVFAPQINSPIFPDTQHKAIKEFLWLDAQYSSGLVDQELIRNELQVRHVGKKIVGLLKACADQNDLRKGFKLHAYVCEHKLLEKDCYVASTLVSMYARCGSLEKAQELLDELPMRDAVIFTALIAAYAQQGQAKEALECLDSMQHEGFSPNAITLTCALKACGSIGAATKGEQIHDKIVSLGMLEKDVVLGSALVDMYCKCGALVKAEKVLNNLSVRNIVTWNALIAGHAQQGHGDEALKCFQRMQQEGHSPNASTFVCALKACGDTGKVVKGEQIYAKIINFGVLEKDAMLGNALIDLYAKCGALTKAQQVFDKLPIQDASGWTALIVGYAQQDQGKKALKCFDSMRHAGYLPDAITFMCALKACGSIGAVDKGEEIHDKIFRLGMLEKHIGLGNALVDMYARCGELLKAQQVLDDLPHRDVVSWNALISGLVQKGQGLQALKHFYSMQSEGHSPDAVTYICALKACGSIGAVAMGQQIHDKVACLHMLERETVIASALVDMYAKCGALDKAQQVFNDLPVQNVVTWNALIAGHAQQGQGKDALECFDAMQRKGHSPDAVAFTCALKACGSIGATAKGKEIHDKIVSLGLLMKDVVLGNSLVDMYAKCGAFAMAQKVLNELPVRNAISWNALIAGYAQQGQGEEALKCFDKMQDEGHSPDVVTFICALKACGSIGLIAKGQQIDYKIVSSGILEKDTVVQSAVVDMYARCGALTKAQQVFNELSVQNVVAWNSIIGGYAQQGQSGKALNLFERMQSEGIRPDLTTMICMLSACSHSGLLDQSEMLFGRMNSEYGIVPNVEHYCCIINLFGRAGKLDKALIMVEKISSVNDILIWLTLLGTCCKWGDSKVGGLAFEHTCQLDKDNATAYVYIANIYTIAGLHEDAQSIDVMDMVG